MHGYAEIDDAIFLLRGNHGIGDDEGVFQLVVTTQALRGAIIQQLLSHLTRRLEIVHRRGRDNAHLHIDRIGSRAKSLIHQPPSKKPWPTGALLHGTSPALSALPIPVLVGP